MSSLLRGGWKGAKIQFSFPNMIKVDCSWVCRTETHLKWEQLAVIGKSAQWVGDLVSNKVEQVRFLITLITCSKVWLCGLQCSPNFTCCDLILLFIVFCNQCPLGAWVHAGSVAYLVAWMASSYPCTELSKWWGFLEAGGFITLHWQWSPKLPAL